MRDGENETPLHVAAKQERIECLRAMLATDKSEECRLITATGHPPEKCPGGYECDSTGGCWDFPAASEEYLRTVWQKRDRWVTAEKMRKMREEMFG